MKSLIAIIAAFFFMVGGMVLYFIFSENPPPSNKNLITEEESLPLPTIEEELTGTLTDASISFLNAYISYSAEDPLAYVENMAPHVTDSFLKNHRQMPKREPLNILEYSWNQVDSKISVTLPVDHMEDQRSKYTVYAEVQRIKTTAEGISEEPKDYFMEMFLIDGKWLVSEVNIQDGERY